MMSDLSDGSGGVRLGTVKWFAPPFSYVNSKNNNNIQTERTVSNYPSTDRPTGALALHSSATSEGTKRTLHHQQLSNTRPLFFPSRSPIPPMICPRCWFSLFLSGPVCECVHSTRRAEYKSWRTATVEGYRESVSLYYVYPPLWDKNISLSLLSSYTFLLYGSMKRSQTQVFHRKKPLDKFYFFSGIGKDSYREEKPLFLVGVYRSWRTPKSVYFPPPPPPRISLSLPLFSPCVSFSISLSLSSPHTHTHKWAFFFKTRCV